MTDVTPLVLTSVSWPVAKGRGLPLILENAPGVEFREIARLFIASFERPALDVVTSPETSPFTPEKAKEAPKKRQRNTKDGRGEVQAAHSKGKT
jgi:hypothetical protein